MQPDNDKEEQLATLEDPSSLVVESEPTPGGKKPNSSEPQLPKKRYSNLRRFLPHFNLYLVGLILLVVLAALALYIGMRLDTSNRQNGQIPGESLTAEELSKLQNNDAKVGDPKQTLTIESNTVINGRVLLRDDLDVAGTIKVGGSLNLPGITVSGNSNFEQIQASSLSITGDTNIQGSLGVQRNLTVTGNLAVGGTFSAGQLSVQALSLSSDLQLNRHIDAGGSTPGRSDGASLGGGGTTSVSGTDTAGTVTINTGSGPTAGCYINVSFAQRFNSTPHVVITPVGSVAGNLNFYINRSATSFSICSANSPPGGSSFSFDYIVID